MSKNLLAFVSLKHGNPYNTVEFRWPTRTEMPSRIRNLTPQQFSVGLELVVNTVDLLTNNPRDLVSNTSDRVRELEKELVEMKAKYENLEIDATESRRMLLEYHTAEKGAMKELYEDVIRKFERALVDCKVSLANASINASINSNVNSNENEDTLGKVSLSELSKRLETRISSSMEDLCVILSDLIESKMVGNGASVDLVNVTKARKSGKK